MPKSGRRSKGKDYTKAMMEQARAASISDDLAAFEEFRGTVLKQLREDLANGLTEDQIVEKYKPLLVARQISIGLTDDNATAALTAIKDLRDRKEGKAIERSEQTHKFEGLEEEQVRSLLQTKLSQLKKEDDEEVVEH